MNIFHLADTPLLAAQLHCDKHCIKMIVEYCQILSTTCHHFGVGSSTMYRKTHLNHPSTVWARQSRQNFEYLLDLTIELLGEYTYRYGKVHASSRLIPEFIDRIDKIPLGENTLTPFVAVLPGNVVYAKTHAQAVDLYKKLYQGEKRYMCTWKIRETPEWMAT